MKFQAFFLGLVAVAHATVFFKEQFDDETWEKRWTYSTSKGSDAGTFKLTSGKFYGDKDRDQGIQTSQDARFYQLSAPLETSFSNTGTLVLQYQVKHEQNIDCGGGYIKLFPKLTPESMSGDSPYNIMFGPDICGPGTKKVHVIFNYKGKNLLTKKDIRCKDDEMTHLYTLIVNPDNTYEVRIDGSKVEGGSLEDDWDFLEPKKIKDPEAEKPKDWVDNAKMDDPDDKKPENWDKPELIPDPDNKRPDDWDEEEDGEWEPPMINNPEFKGEWKPKQIDNPAYKGEWVHPEIDNPNYIADDALFKFDDHSHVGFEIWQVKSGTIFDNIIVTDDISEAESFAKETFDKTKTEEKVMKDKQDENERKKQEEEESKLKKEEGEKKEEDADEEEDDEEEEEDDEKAEVKSVEDGSEEEEEKQRKSEEDQTTDEAKTKDEL